MDKHPLPTITRGNASVDRATHIPKEKRIVEIRPVIRIEERIYLHLRTHPSVIQELAHEVRELRKPREELRRCGGGDGPLFLRFLAGMIHGYDVGYGVRSLLPPRRRRHRRLPPATPTATDALDFREAVGAAHRTAAWSLVASAVPKSTGAPQKERRER